MLFIERMYDKIKWLCYIDASEKLRIKFRVWHQERLNQFERNNSWELVPKLIEWLEP